LHMAQLMLLLLTVSCFSKIKIGFTFLIPAHPSSPGQNPEGCKMIVVVVVVDVCAVSNGDIVSDIEWLKSRYFYIFVFLTSVEQLKPVFNYKGSLHKVFLVVG